MIEGIETREPRYFSALASRPLSTSHSASPSLSPLQSQLHVNHIYNMSTDPNVSQTLQANLTAMLFFAAERNSLTSQYGGFVADSSIAVPLLTTFMCTCL